MTFRISPGADIDYVDLTEESETADENKSEVTKRNTIGVGESFARRFLQHQHLVEKLVGKLNADSVYESEHTTEWFILNSPDVASGLAGADIDYSRLTSNELVELLDSGAYTDNTYLQKHLQDFIGEATKRNIPLPQKLAFLQQNSDYEDARRFLINLTRASGPSQDYDETRESDIDSDLTDEKEVALNEPCWYDPNKPNGAGLETAGSIEKDENLVVDKPTRWARRGNVFFGTTPVFEQIPAGIYSCDFRNDSGFVLVKMRVDTDHLVEIPDAPSDEVLREIRQFWTLSKNFQKFGVVHKRGVLLWGPPGSGKTVTIQQLIQAVIVEHNGVAVLINDPARGIGCLRRLREIEPDRPIIAVMEDFDSLLKRHGDSDFLSLLDGEAQISNVVFVATTNYPQDIDLRFIDRPSRFDVVKEISLPTAVGRRAYLTAKVADLVGDELDMWVAESEGFSIAHLRELIILCRCYEKTFKVAVKRLRELRANRPSSDGTEGRGGHVGFRNLGS